LKNSYNKTSKNTKQKKLLYHLLKKTVIESSNKTKLQSAQKNSQNYTLKTIAREKLTNIKSAQIYVAT